MSFAEGQLAKTWLRLTVFFSLGLQLGLAKTDLWLGAFLTVNISAGGWQSAGILPAIEMAVDDVNNSTDILNDYTLKLSWRDTRVRMDGNQISHVILLLLFNVLILGCVAGENGILVHKE